MKTLKITNPVWLGVLGEKIAEYVKKLKYPTFTYESMYTYFAQTIQTGGDHNEFWIVQDDEGTPIAFANWFILGIPSLGTVYFNHLYSWTGNKKAVGMLIDQFVDDFAPRCRATIYQFDLVNKKVADAIAGYCEERGITMNRQKSIKFLAWKGGK